MKRTYGKLITMLLCLTMLLSLFPMTALAAEGDMVAEDKGILDNIIGTLPDMDDEDIGDIIDGVGNLPGIVPTPTPEVFSGTCGESVTWKFESATDTLTISGTGAVADYGTGDAPWYEHRNKIKSLVVEAGITAIGDNAFRGCQNIITVSLPEGLTAIGSYAFYECRRIETLKLPESATELGQNAFAYCKGLTAVTLPAGLTKITSYLFANCTSLSEVELPAGVTEIGSSAFDGCSALAKVGFPEALTTIGSNAFRNSAIPVFDESSVTVIRQGAFNGCGAMTSFSVPDGITTVNFLGGCTTLKEVYLPISVTEIAAGSFGASEKLSKVYYGGNKLDWKNITIGEDNAGLDKATFLYNCVGLGETAPAVTPTPEATPEVTPEVTPEGDPEVTPTPTPTSTPTPTPTAAPIATPAPNPELDPATCQHSLFFIAPVNPTCYETGLTGKIICGKGCGAVLLEPTVKDKLGHSYKSGTCTRCGHKQGTEDVAPTGTPFKDVKKTDWFAQPVLWAVENGITSGTSATTFSPDAACTRAQIVTFLWAAAGKPEPTVSTSPFSDVKDSDWFCKPVLWAVENDITSGVSEHTFAPNTPCSRAQVVAMLYKAKGSPAVQNSENPFSDVKESNYYYHAVLWALENGVASGASANKFGASQPCTRAQIATFLYKAYK